MYFIKIQKDKNERFYRSIEDESGTQYGRVYLIEKFGTDRTFYQAAKTTIGRGFFCEPESDEVVKKLIRNLYNRKHHRIFEFGSLLFGIRCPIYVERQLRTYRKPEVERSLRYCEPIELVENIELDESNIKESIKNLQLASYRNLRSNGVLKEDARVILPVSILTEVLSLYSVRSLFHVFTERRTSATQDLTRKIVECMYSFAKTAFPITMEAFGNECSRKEKEDPENGSKV